MRYSKHELSTINMLYSLKKKCHINPPTPPPLTIINVSQSLRTVDRGVASFLTCCRPVSKVTR